MYSFDLNDLNRIVRKCIEEEYQIIIIAGGPNRTSSERDVHVTLEKGSTYGGMHMKFSASAPTVQEAFNKAYANFPQNPVGAIWDTKKLAAPEPKATAEDGEFTEYHPPQVDDPNLPPKPDDDDIPF